MRGGKYWPLVCSVSRKLKMVSRLLSSLSGMLSSSPQNSPVMNDNGREDAKNDNDQLRRIKESWDDKTHLAEKAPAYRNSEFALQYVNAESLDRAIVNRLQSRMNTSIEDAIELRKSESRVKLRCEESLQKLPSKTTTQPEKVPLQQSPEKVNDSVNNDTASETSEAEAEAPVPEVPRPRTRSASQIIKESLSQSTVMSHDIPAVPVHSYKNTDFVPTTPSQHDAAKDLGSQAGERRSLMYRNSQFNLENSSREALCSNSSKLLPEVDIQSDTILHLPMFGIPDPSLHRRPSMTSSTESILESAGRTARDTFTSRLRTRARSMSPVPGRSYVAARISGTHIGDQIFESAINEIIEKGGDEFRSKYSSWIWDAFRTQLEKLKTLMLNEFNDKLKDVLEEREHEVMELKKRYREKLSEFDLTADSYQKLMDNMYKENQRVLTAKDFIIEKLKKEFLECKKHFEQDLQRQMQSYRKEAEVERLELQKRNDELMLIMLTDASKCGLEDAFKNEIESLHKMIKTLTAQNEILHKQLDEASTSATIFNRKAVENLETQLDHATLEIMELRKKVQYVEREKEDMIVSHHQDIAKLNRKMQESNTRYDHQLRDTAEELEALRKKHSRETKELKQKLANQESHHAAIIAQVKHQYGSQVESLSHAVSQLRSELTGTGQNTRFVTSN